MGVQSLLFRNVDSGAMGVSYPQNNTARKWFFIYK